MTTQTTLDNYFKTTNNRFSNMSFLTSPKKKPKVINIKEVIVISDNSDGEDFIEKKVSERKIFQKSSVKRKPRSDKKKSNRTEKKDTESSPKKRIGKSDRRNENEESGKKNVESSPNKIRRIGKNNRKDENKQMVRKDIESSPNKIRRIEKDENEKLKKNMESSPDKIRSIGNEENEETLRNDIESSPNKIRRIEDESIKEDVSPNIIRRNVEDDSGEFRNRNVRRNIFEVEISLNTGDRSFTVNEKCRMEECEESIDSNIKVINYETSWGSYGLLNNQSTQSEENEPNDPNLTQNSDKTEEYDISEYEQTIGEYITMSNINDSLIQNDDVQLKNQGVQVNQTDIENEMKIINESEIDIKPDKRYNDENHQRLCINVDKICETVLKNFKELFDENSTEILNSLLSLNHVLHKIFCLRLFTRQDKWYNINDLCKTLNIDFNETETNKMLKILEDNKLIDTDLTKEPVPILLNLLNKPKIREICIESKLHKTPNKKDVMVNALLKNSSTQRTLVSKSSNDILKDKIILKLGCCVRLSPIARDALNKIHILFSLANPELEKPNDIYWLLNRIHYEQIVYPNFTVDTIKIFNTPTELNEYIEAKTLRDQLNEFIQNKQFDDSLALIKNAFEKLGNILNDRMKCMVDSDKPLFIRRFSAGWVYCSIISIFSLNTGKLYPEIICEWLEFLLKQNVYCCSKRGKWFEQLVLVRQSHLKDLKAAIKSLILGLKDEFVSDISKHDLSNRGRKIHKNKLSTETYEKLHTYLLPEIDPFPSRTFQCNVVHDNIPGRKKSFIRTTTSGKEYGSVEETAINFYKDEGIYKYGIHCEGRILCTLFYLLFWDIIYEVHVPNTFISNIQCYPLDMYSGEFYKNRKIHVDDRINSIENVWSVDHLSEFITNVWCEYSKQMNSSISYEFEDVEQLGSIVRCIGNKVMAAVCRRFAEDFRLHRAGLPDLFLWDPSTSKCAFIEVKSEKDKLSMKQILWLNYLKSVGAKIEVCYIQEIGSRNRRNPN